MKLVKAALRRAWDELDACAAGNLSCAGLLVFLAFGAAFGAVIAAAVWLVPQMVPGASDWPRDAVVTVGLGLALGLFVFAYTAMYMRGR